MAERVVTDEQLDELVEQRMAAAMAERKKVVEEVVAALQPQLEGIRKEAASANHVKRTLGRQLASLERLVKQTNAELGKHVVLPSHPGTQDAIERITEVIEKGEEISEQFGIENLSLEQKQALPGMLRNYVSEGLERKKLDRRRDRRMTIWMVATTAAGSLAGAILAAIAVVAYLSSVHVGGTP